MAGFREPNMNVWGRKTKHEREPVRRSRKDEILFRQGGRCAKCRTIFYKKSGARPHFDHIKRVDRGGKSTLKNVQALCPTCHDRKTLGENAKKRKKKKASVGLRLRIPKERGGLTFKMPKYRI